MSLFKEIEVQLKDKRLSIEEFQELIVRLFNYGTLGRIESAVEEELYDRFVRVEELVQEYCAVAHIQILHDRQFQFVRLIPPGAEIPGIKEAQDSAYSGSLRRRLSQNEVALSLVLRTQYDKNLREGKIDDNGFALESLESLSIAMKNLLKRSLPEKLTDRKKLFNHLRQCRLIQFRADEDFASGDAWIKIHPMIVTFISEEVILGLEEMTDPDNQIEQQSQAIEQNDTDIEVIEDNE